MGDYKITIKRITKNFLQNKKKILYIFYKNLQKIEATLINKINKYYTRIEKKEGIF